MTTIVIIPGSFSPSRNYDDLIESLSRHGLSAIAVSIPSVGTQTEGLPAATMSDDVAEIVRLVEPLLASGQKVVLMTHSYGGIPGTQSLEQLSAKSRIARGKSGGVQTIVYLTSVVLPLGMSNFDLGGGKLPDFITVKVVIPCGISGVQKLIKLLKDNYMTLDSSITASLTFSDLPSEQALAWAERMTSHSLPSFEEKLTHAGYNDVDVHYIVCEKDKIISVEAQKGMIEMIKASSKRDVHVHYLNSDHAPIVGRNEDLANILKEIVV